MREDMIDAATTAYIEATRQIGPLSIDSWDEDVRIFIRDGIRYGIKAALSDALDEIERLRVELSELKDRTYIPTAFSPVQP